MEKLFISIPMKDRTIEEIKNEMQIIYREYSDRYELIETIHDYGGNRLNNLGHSISLLGDADLVVFAKDWEKYHGCQTEKFICDQYNIPYEFFVTGTEPVYDLSISEDHSVKNIVSLLNSQNGDYEFTLHGTDKLGFWVDKDNMLLSAEYPNVIKFEMNKIKNGITEINVRHYKEGIKTIPMGDWKKVPNCWVSLKVNIPEVKKLYDPMTMIYARINNNEKTYVVEKDENGKPFRITKEEVPDEKFYGTIISSYIPIEFPEGSDSLIIDGEFVSFKEKTEYKLLSFSK